jgi:hypothetical protein
VEQTCATDASPTELYDDGDRGHDDIDRGNQVEMAVAQVRRGHPVVIGSASAAVLTIPATVATTASLELLEAHGPPTIALRRSHALRFGLRRGPRAGEPGRPQRSVLQLATALTSPHAEARWFAGELDRATVLELPDGGVLEDASLEMLAVELAQLAGFGAVAVTVPVARPVSGRVVVADDLHQAALRRRGPIEVVGVARLPLEVGPVWTHAIRAWDRSEHLVLTPTPHLVDGPTQVIHACLVGQVFRSTRCDCRGAFDAAVRDMIADGRGAVVYLRSPSCGVPCDRPEPRLGAAEQVLVEQALVAVARSCDAPVEVIAPSPAFAAADR